MDGPRFHGSTNLGRLLAAIREGVGLERVLCPDIDHPKVVAALTPLALSEPSVTWFGVNGDRVDVTVSSGGDQWRVVFGVDDDWIRWIDVHRRPPLFEGVDTGCVVVVNGPSGAGKSTLIRCLQALESDKPWVVFDEPEQIGTVNPAFHIWPDQALSLHEGYLAAIEALAAAGNVVAVAAGRKSQVDFSSRLERSSVVWVGLYCDVDVLVERERRRPDRWGGLAEASLDVHVGWEYDLTFDTTKSPDPVALATVVLEHLKMV